MIYTYLFFKNNFLNYGASKIIIIFFSRIISFFNLIKKVYYLVIITGDNNIN